MTNSKDNNKSKEANVSSTENKKLTCFVIMPIADMSGYEARHFDRVYNHIIKPACSNAGFEPTRADEVNNSNFIVLDILKRIVECDIAICDLSARNPNVMYELGLRQAFNKKTVLIKDDKTISPFDVQAFRYCEYDSALRIDNAFNNIKSLEKAITSTYEANSNDVNSIVQLLKIEPAQVGEKTILSTQDTLIFEAIQEISKKMDYNSTIQKTGTSFNTDKAINNQRYYWDFKDQLEHYDIEQLIGLDYNDKQGKLFGKLVGTSYGQNGKKEYIFTNGKRKYTVYNDSPKILELTEDIPF